MKETRRTAFTSVNPYSGETLSTYQALSAEQLKLILADSGDIFAAWRKTPLQSRTSKLARTAALLRHKKEPCAALITAETGKPITEARAEIEKCAWVCEYYAAHAEEFLANEPAESDACRSYVRHVPIGTVFGVMPWNFPFWQVFRFAAPTLAASNTVLLKHAPNVLGCAELIEEIFAEAGFPEGVFRNLILTHEQAAEVIAHPAVAAVTLTGSGKAGSAVAAVAGKHLKKSIMELGGSNAFVVWEDADLDRAVETAVTARMMNTGQSCIAAKRFIVPHKIYGAFTEKLVRAVQKLKSGDPASSDTEIGVCAREDLAETLERQMNDSVAQGAKLRCGGERKGTYFAPAVLTDVVPGMPAFDEETFGPLAAVVRAGDDDEAVALSQQSKFGLGLTICTRDSDRALKAAEHIADGALFINELVKSDPRLPFGGQRESGYGRELGRDGILAFVNRQTVYVK